MDTFNGLMFFKSDKFWIFHMRAASILLSFLFMCFCSEPSPLFSLKHPNAGQYPWLLLAAYHQWFIL